MYTNAKIDGHSIKLILDSGLAGSIITKQLMDQLSHQVNCAASARIITADRTTKTLIGKINNFPIEVNATCGHFKTTNSTTPLIEFEEEKKEPTWEAYQVFWADTEHNELPLVSLWDNNSKGKQKWKEDKKGKRKGKEKEPTTNSNPTYNSYTILHRSTYCHPKLVCVDCDKKLLSMGTCCGNNEEYTLATKFYWNTTYQPTTLSLNLCPLYKKLNSKTFRYNQCTSITNIVKILNTKALQRYTKVVTIETIKKDHSSYRRALFIYFQKDLGIPAETTIAESDFCNYINAKINCLLNCAINTGKLGEQIYQSLLGYSTTTTTQAIAETLHIVNMDIKHYMTKRFFQVQQSVEFNLEKYKDRSNNLTTAQNKSTTKSLGEYESLFGNLTPTEQPLAQNPAESASLLMEKTAILQSIGFSNKEKQPALAPREHSNTWTPISLTVTSNTPPINRIMAYWNIAKLEKFSGLRSSLLRSVQSRHLANLQKAVTLAYNFEFAEQEKLTNHRNREKITTTANIHSNRTVSNSNNLGDPISATKEDNGPKSRKLIPATKISAKHGISIFYPSKSISPVCITSPVYSTTTPKLLLITTNDTSNPLLSNSLLQPAQTSIPIEYPNQASYLGLMENQNFDKSTPMEGRNVEQISQFSKPTKNNILPATITEDITLATIFLFDINNLNTHRLFSEAAINILMPESEE
ncbi:hypothetical protein G9A89_005532 [Geosiphon pyriformis]|nr:hypothetical protein G9A89_005532 [Geosiphon pyriformis]